MNNLAGRSYTFEDGNVIEILQIKNTDEDKGNQIVTYMAHRSGCIPQKYILTISEFTSQFGHLFRDTP
jgi:hypothetical protein